MFASSAGSSPTLPSSTRGCDRVTSQGPCPLSALGRGVFCWVGGRPSFVLAEGWREGSRSGR